MDKIPRRIEVCKKGKIFLGEVSLNELHLCLCDDTDAPDDNFPDSCELIECAIIPVEDVEKIRHLAGQIYDLAPQTSDAILDLLKEQ